MAEANEATNETPPSELTEAMLNGLMKGGTADPTVTAAAAPATPATTTPATTTPAEPVAEATETEVVDPLAPVTQPGTPDKAIQQLQQNLATAVRKIDELTAASQQRDLTAAEQKQVTAAKRSIDSIRAAIGDQSFDVVSHGSELANGLVETDQAVGTIQQQMAQMSQTIAQMQAEQIWATEQARHPGLNVREIFDKAVKETAGYAKHGDAAWSDRATELYQERVANAKKSIAAKGAAKNEPTAPLVPSVPAGNRTGPAVTHGGARLGVTQGAGVTTPAEPSEQQSYEALLAGLTK